MNQPFSSQDPKTQKWVYVLQCELLESVHLSEFTSEIDCTVSCGKFNSSKIHWQRTIVCDEIHILTVRVCLLVDLSPVPSKLVACARVAPCVCAGFRSSSASLSQWNKRVNINCVFGAACKASPVLLALTMRLQHSLMSDLYNILCSLISCPNKTTNVFGVQGTRLKKTSGKFPWMAPLEWTATLSTRQTTGCHPHVPPLDWTSSVPPQTSGWEASSEWLGFDRLSLWVSPLRARPHQGIKCGTFIAGGDGVVCGECPTRHWLWTPSLGRMALRITMQTRSIGLWWAPVKTKPYRPSWLQTSSSPMQPGRGTRYCARWMDWLALTFSVRYHLFWLERAENFLMSSITIRRWKGMPTDSESTVMIGPLQAQNFTNCSAFVSLHSQQSATLSCSQ